MQLRCGTVMLRVLTRASIYSTALGYSWWHLHSIRKKPMIRIKIINL